MDIAIDGDPELQQGVRYSLFAMYINYHGESERRNVVCKLGGEVYSGVNFWGTGIYCHRMFMFLDPEIARMAEKMRIPKDEESGIYEQHDGYFDLPHRHAQAARLDLDNYNRNTEQGIHSSSAAGVWGGMVSGFGGLRPDADTLVFNPSMPAQ
jgi:trehalose/maltose hydrolase-like predicted phosphorylase